MKERSACVPAMAHPSILKGGLDSEVRTTIISKLENNAIRGRVTGNRFPHSEPQGETPSEALSGKSSNSILARLSWGLCLSKIEALLSPHLHAISGRDPHIPP